MMRGFLILMAAGMVSACAPTTVLSAGQASSPWQMIDDFEASDALAAWTIFDADNQTDPFVPDAQISAVRTENGTSNRFLLRKPAGDGIVGNRKALIWKPLPRPIPVGETATIFTRINVEYFPNNHSFGLSNQSGEQIGALAYDAFEPMIRITDKAESDGTKNNGTLMVLNGPRTYASISNGTEGGEAKPLKPGEWYDLWWVVNNANKAEGGQTYNLYVRGGEFADRTLVYSGATFRIGREEPLTHFAAIANTGPARAPYGNGGVRYDDLYMASGELLSDPVPRD